MFFTIGDEIREVAGADRWPSAWRVEGELASGRHYRVYVVRSCQESMREKRAVIKLIRYEPRLCAEPGYVEAQRQRLLKECETLSHFSPRLPEPVDCFEFYNSQDPFGGFGEEQLRATEPALVQTLVHGQTLAQMMEDSGAPPFSAEKLLLSLARVCAFLDELHAGGNGWLFGALSPEHILVDPARDYEPMFVGCSNFKMLRRGVSVLDPVKDALTARYEPGYTAPEALAGAACDRRADIYAVGAILFHLFTGVDPRDLAASGRSRHSQDGETDNLDLDTALDQADRLKRSMERFCRRNLKGLGIHRAQVRKILLRCVSPHPEERFDSPASLRDAILQSLTRSMPVAWTG